MDNHTQKVRVRIYVPNAQIGKTTTLSSEQIRHLKVLRIKDGEAIRLFDGKGHEFEAVYTEKVRVQGILVGREVLPQPEPQSTITLAAAVPKGNRADFLTEKVSELGISKLVPISCARSVVNPREAKIERWRKIAIEACAQSGRAVVPEVNEPTTFAKLMEKVREYDAAFICHKNGIPLHSAYHGEKNILLIIGPEGDFTPEELKAAEEKGCKKVSLGPTVLRVETASIAATTQLTAIAAQQKPL